jgi:hypothetical protein
MATYERFESGDKVFSTEKVYASAWTGTNNNELTGVYSSSAQAIFSTPSSSGNFYIDVYNADVALPTSEVQYSISYGHKAGSGSENFTDGIGGDGYSATRTIYSQYRNLVFGGDETQNFTFNDYTPDDIYVININRARYKNALRLGNINLQLSGSGGLIHLTDDSVTSSGSATLRAGVGREFNLVSGSNGVRLGNNLTQVAGSGSYGKIYPDAGFIILNPAALDATGADGGIVLGTNRTSDNASKNNQKLYNAIGLGESFILDSQETISSRYYFCRVKNTQFNYTTNDSFTESDGTLKYTSMIDNPQVYITTVGLYNDNQDLVAVAKLSQPLPKNFTKEALIKVKLDY